MTRLLLVEDSPTQAQELIYILQDAGLEVEWVADGRRALERAQQERFDLVLTDFFLPGGSGLDLCRRIKDDPSLAHIPVVLITRSANPVNLLMGLEARADGFMGKNNSPAEITGRILRILARRDPATQTAPTQVVFLDRQYELRAERDQLLEVLLAAFENFHRLEQRNQEELRQRRQAEETLRQSEERLGQILETAFDAFIGMNAKGVITAWNAQAEATFGWPRQEAVGRELAATIIPPRYRDAHARGLVLFLATGDGPVLNRRIQLTALHRDGREFPVELTITTIRFGEATLFNAFVHDIGERIQAEEKARSIEERYRLLVEGARDYAVFMLDPTGHVLTWNAGAEHIKGYRAEEIIGQHLSKFYQPEAIARGWPNHELERAAAEGRFEDEGWRLRKDGSRFWASVVITALRDESGQLRAFSKITRDLTEQRRQEERLKAVAHRLRESNRELEQFAAVASHDLQEPLRKIQTFADRLQTRCGHTLDERGRDYLGRMLDAATRMRKLINDLLALSRLTTTAKPFVQVDLNQAARDVVADLEGTMQQAGGRVELGSLPCLEADPVQMRQLLQNLIANGLKFHRPGEAPVVRVEGKIVPQEGTGGTPGGGELLCQITVADNGTGFEEIYVTRIFEVFQRLHGQGQYEGTGMGLAICRRIVERHRGTITAQSTPGNGATFIVTLPVVQTTSPG